MPRASKQARLIGLVMKQALVSDSFAWRAATFMVLLKSNVESTCFGSDRHLTQLNVVILPYLAEVMPELDDTHWGGNSRWFIIKMDTFRLGEEPADRMSIVPTGVRLTHSYRNCGAVYGWLTQYGNRGSSWWRCCRLLLSARARETSSRSRFTLREIRRKFPSSQILPYVLQVFLYHGQRPSDQLQVAHRWTRLWTEIWWFPIDAYLKWWRLN